MESMNAPYVKEAFKVRLSRFFAQYADYRKMGLPRSNSFKGALLWSGLLNS